jgi:hypothetical protein
VRPSLTASLRSSFGPVALVFIVEIENGQKIEKLTRWQRVSIIKCRKITAGGEVVTGFGDVAKQKTENTVL